MRASTLVTMTEIGTRKECLWLELFFLSLSLALLSSLKAKPAIGRQGPRTDSDQLDEDIKQA